MGFGKNLKNILDKKNKTVVWLSKETGIPSTTIYSMIKRDNVPLAPSIVQVFKKQKALQAEQQLKSYGLWDNADNLIFTDAQGKHLTHSNLYKHFKKIVESIGIPDARFHDLRHSYAVTSLQSGNDVKTVQEALGHHTAAFTLDVYGHVTEQMRKESAARLEGFIQNIKPI